MTDEETAFWAALPALSPQALAPELRRRLAVAWSKSARDEHASIAAFSRFSLQLLAVGAPPSLLQGAHAAALDEIVHARLCFALAGAYAGEPLGPGPLPIPEAAVGPCSLASVAAATALEGCIGETLAALAAEAARDGTTEPATRAALGLIAQDEMRHAELAWSFVRWSLETGGTAPRDAVRAAFESGMAQARAGSEVTAIADDALLPYGVLGAARRREVHLRAIDSVIEPALRALLA